MADDPLNTLTASAVQLHEMYISLQAAGFTETEALTILLAMIASRGGS